MVLIVFALNWAAKLLMAWLLFLLANWLGLPDWGVIAFTAIGAAETRITMNFNNGWSVG